MADLSKHWDVLVVGGGNAALCAAISAREQGASVLVIEHAPKVFRGGNSRHTRNLRCMHSEPQDVLSESYSEDEYWEDLMRVTGGNTDEKLARMAIRESESVREWMKSHGVRFQPSLSGTLSLSRTNAFFLGGGKALVNAYYLSAEKMGVEIEYDTEVEELVIEDGVFKKAVVNAKGFPYEIRANSLVVAAGGFQANIDWLKEAWGPAAENFIIRGTPYNKGRLLKELINNGFQPVGEPDQCHAVAIDARSPKFDGGIVTRLDCVSFGIVVNNQCERFYDEGEDFWPKRYAIWGRLVAAQPDQIGYVIIDSQSINNFMPSVFPPVKANSIEELAAKLKLDPAKLQQTVDEFNAHVTPGTFDNTVLDDCCTEGLTPPKTHWARKIVEPPFYGYPLRPGITFTYLGVKVDENARALMADGQPSKNVFAAGEVMAGNVLGKGYLAGLGMTIGTVFGRIAGKEASHGANS
ncbi:FAD-dependent tricarballylate dehydrogenase TcuA [Photobacterium rosenbergii]|uniref:Tricarballylate dehydrogenase n=1 Tax=Photobacterium rosenbergii TaxID=294936 RepID=A0A2T3N6E9_9GAMM|nr:FAD-dependent tricarballylate dehydrogenase TcuA [Photobacterium rosenbergii]MBY5944640.1 FAD-dependent tricarballylate dehydrogenase TcuA [Photobacterium rosenbergii]PSW08285.1 tricarballylate dehydrogenase [Photobacterium rosenbergii]